MSEYNFTIRNSWTPKTLPMGRLAAYMDALARLIGEPERVHFADLKQGSAIVAAVVDEPAELKVAARVAQAANDNAPDDLRKAYEALDGLLRDDNATGSLDGPEGLVLSFLGRDRPEPIVFGPFRQEATLYGELIRIGGKDSSVHAQLRDGARIHTGLHCDQALARRLAPHLYGRTLKVHGEGVYIRTGDGVWELKNYRIEAFEVLDDEPLSETMKGLRSVHGIRWHEVEDPVAELLSDRHGGAERN